MSQHYSRNNTTDSSHWYEDEPLS